MDYSKWNEQFNTDDKVKEHLYRGSKEIGIREEQITYRPDGRHPRGKTVFIHQQWDEQERMHGIQCQITKEPFGEKELIEKEIYVYDQGKCIAQQRSNAFDDEPQRCKLKIFGEDLDKEMQMTLYKATMKPETAPLVIRFDGEKKDETIVMDNALSQQAQNRIMARLDEMGVLLSDGRLFSPDLTIMGYDKEKTETFLQNVDEMSVLPPLNPDSRENEEREEGRRHYQMVRKTPERKIAHLYKVGDHYESFGADAQFFREVFGKVWFSETEGPKLTVSQEETRYTRVGCYRQNEETVSETFRLDEYMKDRAWRERYAEACRRFKTTSEKPDKCIVFLNEGEEYRAIGRDARIIANVCGLFTKMKTWDNTVPSEIPVLDARKENNIFQSVVDDLKQAGYETKVYKAHLMEFVNIQPEQKPEQAPVPETKKETVKTAPQKVAKPKAKVKKAAAKGKTKGPRLH